jgi:uncharacterized membrane protein YdjX (TVP38/TMEM64 family)
MSKFTLRRPSKRALTAIVLAAGVGGFFAFMGDFGALRQSIAGVNDGLFFLLLSVLPIFGFPISVLQILAGVKFGFWTGVGLTSVSMACHLLGVYWLASSFLRRPVSRLLSRTRYRLPEIPEGQSRTIAFLIPFLPGSYTLKNYLMVLGGISLRTLLWVCLPVYAVRASSGIFLGDATGNFTPTIIAVLIAGKIVAVASTAWILKRYGAQLKMSALRTVGAPQSVLP